MKCLTRSRVSLFREKTQGFGLVFFRMRCGPKQAPSRGGRGAGSQHRLTSDHELPVAARGMHYILGRIVVGFVLCLISFISYSSQIFIIWPWYGREWSVELVTLLAPFKYVLSSIFLGFHSTPLQYIRGYSVLELLSMRYDRPWNGSSVLGTSFVPLPPTAADRVLCRNRTLTVRDTR